MKLDQTLIAVRPRGVLERLDLAFLLCGRYPLGIFPSLAVGVIPCLLLNWWLLADADDEQFGLFMLIVLPVQLPFATLWLTLYLGQMTFARSFSMKEAIKVVYEQSFALFLYQVILRGVLCLLIVLSPVVAFGMYHMNEIILLERSGIKTSWLRRRVLHDNRVGDIFVSRMIELLVFFFGVIFLMTLLGMLSRLWNDHTSVEQLLAFDEDWGDQENPLLTWQFSASFFMTIGFLRIYRFVTYLDSRIRYEGWDVELKIRSVAKAYARGVAG